MSTQLQLPIALPISRPLLPLEVVMVLLDRNEDDVLALIDTGELSWAWDIRTPAADRREIRVWRDDVLRHLDRTSRGIRPADPLPLDQVMTAILPHSRPEIRSTEIQRIFSCSSSHVLNLVQAGCLAGLNAPGTGPNGFVRVTRLSVIQFLQLRTVK